MPTATGVGGEAPSEAFEEGRRAGRAEAEQRLGQELRMAMQALEQARHDFAEARNRLVSEGAFTVYELALAVARHVVQREVEVDRALVVRFVEQALDAVGKDESMEIRMNPADLEAAQDLIAASRWPDDILWIPDPTLDRGGCKVSTPKRIIDGSLDTIMTEIGSSLNDE